MSTGTVPYWLDAPYDPRPPLAGRARRGRVRDRRAAPAACRARCGSRSTASASRCWSAGRWRAARAGATAASCSRGGALPQRRARALRGRAREGDVHAHVRRAGGRVRARDGPRRGRCGSARGNAAGGGVRGGGRARARIRAGARRGRLPRRAGRARGPAGGAQTRRAGGCLTEHDGALHPARWYRALAGAAEAAGARIFEGTEVQPPGGGARRRPGARGLGQRARPPRRRGRGRRAAGAGARVRGPRAAPPAPHGRHRAGAAGVRHARLRALGIRVPPAATRRAHPRRRLQRRGRRGLLHGQRRRQPGDLGARAALPRRRDRRGGGDNAPLGGRGGLQRGLAPVRGRGARAPGPLRVGRVLRRGQRARLHERPRHRRHDRGRAPRAAVPAGPR